ncbi:MAG: PfkB family carbohydrate kinase [Myxococcota bacterium]
MSPSSRRLRLGVIGHVEHIVLGRVPRVPRPGDIAHLQSPVWFPGGGGGVTFHQLVRSSSEVHLFTAIGNDEAGQQVERAIAATGAHVHAARRAAAHTRDIVMIEPNGERTIVVVGEPLHPSIDDPLPWHLLDELDAVYFTAQDPQVLARARTARILVSTARRQPSIRAANIDLDVVVGSRADPREVSDRADYARPPRAVVMTEGAKGGTVETKSGTMRFKAPILKTVHGGAYGAGDSFAGALVHFIALGATPLEAAKRAAPFGAAVLAALDPLRAQQELPDHL